MKNPGLKTLRAFLTKVQTHAPASYTDLSRDHTEGYGMINRYIDYCLGQGLIRVEKTRRGRGRYPQKTYGLTEKGAALLSLIAEPTPLYNRRVTER